MSDDGTRYDGDVSVDVERLVHKGKGVLELCLERNKVLCVKGFIDCQMERGGEYVKVVECMVEYIGQELDRTHDKHRKSVLLDLKSYAAQQLQVVSVTIDMTE